MSDVCVCVLCWNNLYIVWIRNMNRQLFLCEVREKLTINVNVDINYSFLFTEIKNSMRYLKFVSK